jgi:hypothetical protein
VDYIEAAIDLPMRSEAPTENELKRGFTVDKHEHREDKLVVNGSLFEATKGAGLPSDPLEGVLMERFCAPQRNTRKETETLKYG